MSVDWKQEALDPIYAEFGVDAFLNLPNGTVTVTAIADRQDGTQMVRGYVESPSEQRVLLVRIAELLDLEVALEDLESGATITYKSKTYAIASFNTEPLPDDDEDGEVVLILEEQG